MPHARRTMLVGPMTSGALALLLLAPPAAASAGTIPAGTIPASTVPASTVPASTVPASTVPASTVPASTVPAARAGGASLLGVSCTGSARCMAVGSRAAAGRATHTLAERWSAGRWRIVATPNPAGAGTSILIEVSCRDAASCVAVGSATSKAHGTVALAEAWNGSAWRLTRPVRPAGAGTSELLDVSCTGSSLCLAAGFYRTRSGRLHPLTESWNGVRWRALATPDRHGARAGVLAGLSCAGPTCKAVGFAQLSASLTVGLAEAWNGTSWRVLAFPSPAMASFVGVQDVSCRGSTACMAVGMTFAPATTSLAEVWHSGKWRLVTAAARSPAEAMLNGVSCPAATRCVAVGESGSGPVLLAEAWNGTRWRVLQTPDPAAGTVSFLNQVSCPRVGRCMAVGSRGSGKSESALAEVWNGISWRVLSTPAP
jgi:hypothetical protein